jgi:hypothetical protein
VQAETKDEDIPQELFERKLKQLIGTSKNLRESGLELRRSLESTIGYSQTASAYVFALLDHKLDGLAALVDPAQQAQNAAEAAARIADLEVKSVARIADLELKVASAAEIGAAAQPVLAALERLEASQAAQNIRLAALEARPVCCVIS